MDEYESPTPGGVPAPPGVTAVPPDEPIAAGAGAFRSGGGEAPAAPSAPPTAPAPGTAAAPADELRPLMRRLLDQTASLPSLGDQIGGSLEVFGDRLVDGLNEIFGTRLATMVEEMQTSIEEALGESRRQFGEVEARLEGVTTAADEIGRSLVSLVERVGTLETAATAAPAPAPDTEPGADLVGEITAVRRAVEKLDRAGTIRRKRIDQLRSRVDDVVTGTGDIGDRMVAELASSRAVIEELGTWLGAVHTEVEELRDQVAAGALTPPPPPPPPVVDNTVPQELVDQLAKLAEELELLRKRVPVRAAAPTLDDRQVQAIGETVVSAIFDAVQLESGEFDEDAEEAE